MNKKQRKTGDAIFADPIRRNIVWDDVYPEYFLIADLIPFFKTCVRDQLGESLTLRESNL